MECPYCKKKIPEESTFCPECGQTATADEKYETTNGYWNATFENNPIEDNIDNNAKSGSLIYILAGGIAVAIGVMALFTVINKDKRESASETRYILNQDISTEPPEEKNDELEKEIGNIDEVIAELTTNTEQDTEYVLEGSDSRYLSKSDLDGLSADDCRLARNEIYARHGRKFNDELLQSYFDSKSWYNGTIDPNDFQESMLNNYEIANRDLIVTHEEEYGYR